MHKKNTPNPKNLYKSSSSGLTKFAITTGIIANTLISIPSFGQTTKTSLQQKTTKIEVIDTIKYDYQKLLYIDISTLSPELIKKVMLDRLNEIRKEHKLKPLKYDKRLDSLACEFAEEKNGTERWKDRFCHFDKQGNGIYERASNKGLIKHIKKINVNGDMVSLGENLVTSNGSVYDMIASLMASKQGHKERILSPYENKVGFGYTPGLTIFVQIFAEMID